MARRKRRREAAETVAQDPWRQPANPYAPTEVLSAEDVARIDDAAMRVLEDVGIEALGDAALDLYAQGGADVDRAARRVRLDRGLVRQALATAPAEFRLHARNPARDVVIGGRHLAYCNATTPPFASDLGRGRRPGSFADFTEMLKLGQMLNTLHFFYGYPVEPQDVPPETRHLDCYAAHATLTDKAWRAYALSAERVEDALEIARIARGIGEDQMQAEPSVILNMNTNSPLRVDGPMSDGLIAMSRLGQPVVISAFTMAGAMAPVTMAGALVQQTAEVLAGVVLTQLARPGAPVVYGAFTSNVHMRSGAIALGTPEFALAQFASAQLARFYRLPSKGCNANSSNAADAQAAYESGMATWSAVMGQSNIMAHGLGWLEAGLTASYEKMIIDAEMLQMMTRLLEPLKLDDASLGLDAIRDVGPGGHFFSTPHTLERFETAFYEPLLSDWRPFEAWQEAGSEDATQRAHGLWQRLLAEYQAPAMDPAIAEEIAAYIARRKGEVAEAA